MNEVEKLKEENKELKARIKKYAELNEQDTKDYAALHNENIKLNAIIDSYQPRLQALQEENKQLKERLDISHFLEGLAQQRSKNHGRAAEKYFSILQEIKEIAEGIRNATYQFGQEADKKFFNETLGKILQKITKAEEE